MVVMVVISLVVATNVTFSVMAVLADTLRFNR